MAKSPENLDTQQPDDNYQRLLKEIAINSLTKTNDITLIIGSAAPIHEGRATITPEKMVNKIVDRVDPSRSNTLGSFSKFKNFIDFYEKGKVSAHLLEMKRVIDHISPIGWMRTASDLWAEGKIKHIITTDISGIFSKLISTIHPSISEREKSNRFLELNGSLETKVHPCLMSWLPDKLKMEIEPRTKCLTILMHLSPQDMGLTNHVSLNCEAQAYHLTTGNEAFDFKSYREQVSELLSARNSVGNDISLRNVNLFFYDFMTQSKSKSILDLGEGMIHSSWFVGRFGVLLKRTSKMIDVFFYILKAGQVLRQNKEKWIKASPLYSSSYVESRKMLQNSLNTFSDLERFKSEITNEVDVIVLLTGVELLAINSGSGSPLPKDLDEIKKIYKRFEVNYKPSDEFWDFLAICLGTSLIKPETTQLKIFLNNESRLALISKEIPLEAIKSLLNLSSTLSPFLDSAKTIIEPTDEEAGRARQLARDKLTAVKVKEDKIYLTLAKLTNNEANLLVEYYFHRLDNIETMNIQQGRIISRHANITFENLSESDIQPQNELLWEMIYNQSQDTARNFEMAGSAFMIQPENSVQLELDEEIEQFLKHGTFTGMFVVGSSGSGKTTALQSMVRNKDPDVLPFVISPLLNRIENRGIGKFLGPIFSSQERQMSIIEECLTMAIERRKKLLFVVDALNEFPGEFDNLKDEYIDLMNFVGNLSEVCKHSGFSKPTARIIITCRETTFERLNKARPIKFYDFKIFDNYGKADSFFLVKPLDSVSIQKFIDETFHQNARATEIKQLLQDSPHLSHELAHPYLLTILGNNLEKIDIKNLHNASDIFKIYAEEMLDKAKEVYRDRCKDLINGIFDILSEDFSNRDLSEAYTIKHLDKILEIRNVIKELVDVNIISPTHLNFRRIVFKHDRVEEYFLGVYLHGRRNSLSLFKQFFGALKHSSVYPGALKWYFIESVVEYDEKKRINLTAQSDMEHLWKNISVFESDTHSGFCEFIVTAFFRSTNIEEIVRDSMSLSLGHTRDEDWQTRVFHYFILGLERTISKFLWDKSLPLIKVLNGYAKNHSNVALLASMYYLRALVLKKSSENQKGSSALSSEETSSNQNTRLKYLNKAAKILERKEDLEIYDKVQLELGITNREGDKHEDSKSILLMVYKKHLESGNKLRAFNSGLELGRVYRELGLIDKAIDFYKQLHKAQFKFTTEQKALLNLQIGNCYKNLIQSHYRQVCQGKMAPRKGNISVLRENFEGFLHDALESANSAFDISIQLECISEWAEYSVTLARWVPGKISDAYRWLGKYDELLSKFYIVKRRIEYLRISAFYYAWKSPSELEMCFQNFKKALLLAEKDDLAYSINDCDFEFGELVAQLKKNDPFKFLWGYRGLNALNRALSFFAKKNMSEKIFAVDLAEDRKQLEEWLEENKNSVTPWPLEKPWWESG